MNPFHVVYKNANNITDIGIGLGEPNDYDDKNDDKNDDSDDYATFKSHRKYYRSLY